MKTLVSATILLVSLTNAIAQSSSGIAAVRPSSLQQRSAAATADNTLSQTQSIVIATNQPQQVGDLEDQAREMVLVVPTPDLKGEAFAAITEDMTVMCRIFDKTVYPSARLPSRYAEIALLNRLPWRQTARTQGLYLDGYGAVFFFQVDFPLVPAPQQKEQPKPDEATDRVWSQTWNELRGQEEPRDGDDTAPAYDAQKVENLKTALVKTLRHAANLRARPQDQITVVIASQTRTSTRTSREQLLRGLHYSLEAQSAGPMPKGAKWGAAAAAYPAATLVLRVSKADVDALAAGQLTAEQFAPRVQTLWSTTQPQTPEPPSTPSPSPAPRL
jgi:hypothetical protein